MRRISPLLLLPLCILCGLLVTAGSSSAQQNSVPANVDQLLVAISKTWDSDKALLWGFERGRDESWQSTMGEAKPVMLGRSGLAWGRGVLPNPSGNTKREGDGRTPAGLFRIGQIYGYPDSLPRGSRFTYRQIGEWDCWVDDPQNPYYNQHVVVRPGQEPSWFQSQRMRLGDHAYTYRVEVRHNSDPPVPGMGSAIFFHYRRGPDRATAGCTALVESDLHEMIRWLRENKNPHYVILPQAEYDRLQQDWGLPEFR